MGRLTGTRFAPIPVWLLDARVSDRAIRLYATLQTYLTGREGAVWPSRRTLAERLSCSADSIDRCVRELTTAGGLRVEHRKSNGEFDSNEYIVLFDNPEVAAPVRPPSRTTAATPAATTRPPQPQGCGDPSRTGAALIRTTEEEPLKKKASSSPRASRDNAVETSHDDDDARIDEALRLVAERAVADQPGVRDPKAYLAKAVRNAHTELGDRVQCLARQHPDWPASRIAAETVKLGAPDPRELSAAAARAIATKDRSCPECGGAGVREIEPGVAVRCTHGEAA